MRNKLAAAALVSAGLAALAVTPTDAHVVVGDHVFPVTLTFDDPGVGDEATLPQSVYSPGLSGQNAQYGHQPIERQSPRRRRESVGPDPRYQEPAYVGWKPVHYGCCVQSDVTIVTLAIRQGDAISGMFSRNEI